MDAERAERVDVDLSPKNPFGMTFKAPDKNKSLFVEEPANFGEGTPTSSQDLMRTVILAHLVIRHFPTTIKTNFNVDHTIFLNKLYKHYGFAPPKIIKDQEQIKPAFVELKNEKKQKVMYANAHSGGLDSLYRVAKLLNEDEKVLIAHLRNLNPKGSRREATASGKQAKALGLPYEEIILRNGTDNTGFDTMRTRDMFLSLAVAMTGEPYGIQKVFIEGDMQEDPHAHFSEYSPAWIFFNRLIASTGLHSQIEGMDAHDIETVGEVLKLEGELKAKGLKVDLLPLVQNCFSAEYQVHNNRRKWERETPLIASRSPEHWCGSCIKCRRMTLGRIFYNDPKLRNLPRGEVDFFIKDTKNWLKTYNHNSDLVTGDFIAFLDRLAEQRRRI